MRIQSVSYGFTKNLGNFQSQRLDVTVTLEDDSPEDNADAALELAVAFINEALDLEVSDRERQILAVYRETEYRERAMRIEDIR